MGLVKRFMLVLARLAAMSSCESARAGFEFEQWDIDESKHHHYQHCSEVYLQGKYL